MCQSFINHIRNSVTGDGGSRNGIYFMVFFVGIVGIIIGFGNLNTD